MVNMNRLTTAHRARIVAALVEGDSRRATARVCDVSKNTVMKLLVDLGEACVAYQDATLRNLPCRRIQCDEIWAFCHAKAKNVAPEHEGVFGYGDVWTWTAIDADTKLVPSWLVGLRNGACAVAFIEDLASRLSHRVQLSTDGHRPYLEAVEGAFGSAIDYAQVIKLYEPEPGAETRYSPAQCIGIEKRVIQGQPDEAHISTSYVERQNLTMRMSMRRFTRLTNAFSKKVENLEAAVALHYMWYNFGRKHQSLQGRTPAMAAGVASRVWTVEEIAALLDKPK